MCWVRTIGVARTATRPGDQYRLYEVAGAPHADAAFYPYIPLVEDEVKAGGDAFSRLLAVRHPVRTGDFVAACSIMTHALDGAFANLTRWVRDGVPAPRAERVAVQNSGTPQARVVLDEFGNAVGARAQPVSGRPRWPPTARTPAVRGCAETSRTRRTSTGRALEALYGSPGAYATKLSESVDRLVQERWLTESDGNTVKSSGAGTVDIFALIYCGAPSLGTVPENSRRPSGSAIFLALAVGVPLRLKAFDRHQRARFDIARAPSAPVEGVRTAKFQRPVQYLAILALHVDVNPCVRIRPKHRRDRAGERDRLGVVELGRERMMRRGRRRGIQTMAVTITPSTFNLMRSPPALCFGSFGPNRVPDVLQVLQILVVLEARHFEQLSCLPGGTVSQSSTGVCRQSDRSPSPRN